MSITLGIYDLFAYLIPGMAYLFVINEFSKLAGRPLLDVTAISQSGENAPGIVVLILLLAGAYLTGHIFDIVAHWFVYRLIYRSKTSDDVLAGLKSRYPSLKLDFEAKDWVILLVLLRQRNLDLIRSYDKYEADSIMFRNISLLSFLVFMVAIGWVVINHASPWYLLLSAAALVICSLAYKSSRRFHAWFFESIYLSSLEYGNSLQEVMDYQKQRSARWIPQNRKRLSHP